MKRADEIELQVIYQKRPYSIGHLAQNKDKQVLFAFNVYGWHLTLHKENDGSILRTLYDPKKRRKSIDHQYVDTARALGYKDPDRHGNYVAHSPLIFEDKKGGYHLVTIGIDLLSLPGDNKSNAREKVYLNTIEPNIKLEFYQMAKEITIEGVSTIIPSKLGNLFISLQQADKAFPQ